MWSNRLSHTMFIETRPLSSVRIQQNEQVSVAAMVPIGIDFCGSRRSPDMFEPVMMPITQLPQAGNWRNVT